MLIVSGYRPTSLAGVVRRLAMVALACAAAGADAAPRFPVCLDYHCDEIAQQQLLDHEWRAIEALFATNRSPHEERANIGRAIALIERQVGARTGTWRDLAGNRAGAGQPGQLDCIAESRNTTTYLRLLQRRGLLEWHRVEPPVRRRRWLILEHWTAVVRDLTQGARYAVDAWHRDNGLPPIVQPLAAWYRAEPPVDDRGRR